MSQERSHRIAVVDVGSNTVHMLVADSDGTSLLAVDDQSTRLQLGTEVARLGAFAQEKMHAAAELVGSYVAHARELRAEAVYLLGTEAVRRATNETELARLLNETTGLPLQHVSPTEEAHLGYLGTTLDRLPPGPRLTVDIGGGSTEQVLTTSSGEIVLATSVPLGAVALPARFLHSDPPSAAQRAKLEAAVQVALNQAVPAPHERPLQPDRIVLIGGLGWRLLAAGQFHPERPLEGSWIEWLAAAAMKAPAGDSAVFGELRAEDAPLVRAGATVLHALMAAWDVGCCQVSHNGIREGAILALARGRAVGHAG